MLLKDIENKTSNNGVLASQNLLRRELFFSIKNAEYGKEAFRKQGGLCDFCQKWRFPSAVTVFYLG